MLFEEEACAERGPVPPHTSVLTFVEEAEDRELDKWQMRAQKEEAEMVRWWCKDMKYSTEGLEWNSFTPAMVL